MRIRSWPLAAVVTPLWWGCGTTLPPDEPPQPPPVSVREVLPAGTILRLTPSTSSPADSDTRFVDALWREALRQSRYFDIAATSDEVPEAVAPAAIVLHRDQGSQHLTSTLVRPDQPPLPLASAVGSVTTAIDDLAIATCESLGEQEHAKPRPAAAIYSSDPDCVELTERAAAFQRRGSPDSALPLLRRARRLDPGCAVTMSTLATTLLTLGAVHNQPALVAEARRVATDALQLEQRLSANTKHRLAHAALTAQAQTHGTYEQADRDLLTLGEVAMSERPYAPQGKLTKAVALNLLARYSESLPLLRELARRLPQSGEVGYHLTFAEIAAGDPQRGLAAIQTVRDRLPPHSAGLPISLALYHCGRTEDLRRYLTDLSQTPAYRRGPAIHQLLQMRASLALLTDRPDDAVDLMLDDIEWMRQRPSEIERHSIDLAELGEVIVRVGRGSELQAPLEALSDMPELPSTVAEVLVFLAGLLEVSSSGQRAVAAESHLRQAGQVVWASVLKAAAHQQRGELMDELKERVFEYQSSDTPLTRAALVRVLRAAGSDEQATTALDQLAHQLLPFRLRRPRQHPLMAPSSALAYLAVRSLSPEK